MNDTPTTAAPAHSTFKVLAALADLGEATAAAVAEYTQLGYSTVTPKLRAWETSGHVERFRNDANQTLWRLTANGRATTATPGEHAAPPPPASRAADDAPTTNPADGEAPATVGLDVPVPAGMPDGTERENVDVPSDADADDRDDREGTAEPPADPIAPDTAEPEPAPAPEPARGPERAPAPQDAIEPQDGDDKISEPEPAVPDPTPDAAGDETTVEPASRDAAPGSPTSADRDGDPSTPGTAPSSDNGDTTDASATDRRPSGSLRGAILDILEANPDTSYKISELCKLIDRANEGTSAKKASAGAVANAAHKLVETGRAALLAEKPATFGLPTADA